METFRLGIMASIYGLGGVFAVLILFYILTRIMFLLFKPK